MRNEEKRQPSGRNENFDSERLAGIDYFRMAAAFLVIGIHIAPFSSWNEDVDFLLTYCLGRVAVPFFFMTTGYFVLAPYVKSGFGKKRSFYRFVVKNTVMYLAITVMYLPLTIYSGNVPEDMFGWMKALVFDGTFYHLWYFPAVLLGCILLVRLPGVRYFRVYFTDLGQENMQVSHGRSKQRGKLISVWAAAACVAAAYVAGLFGDSYYGAVEGVAWIRTLYDGIFQISSYTRNGIFFAPIFLMLGMGIAFMRKLYSKRICIWGLALSGVFLLGEGFLTYSLKWQRHNSMYFFLVPVMFFLFQLLLMISGKAPAFFRKGSLILYVVHPAVIVVLRGAAKASGLTELLVENTFVQYLTVCIGTLMAAYVYLMLKERFAAYVG